MLTDEDRSTAFAGPTIERLPLAGIGPWSHYVYLKHRGLLARSSSGPRKRFVRSTPETGSGYSPWMGSPFGPGTTGDDVDAYLPGFAGSPSFGTFRGSKDHILAAGTSDGGPSRPAGAPNAGNPV